MNRQLTPAQYADTKFKSRHIDSPAQKGGKTQGKINADNGTVIKAGKISATKQWQENRDGELQKCKKGGAAAYLQKKGCHSLSKKELSKAGKTGYANGLGKLSKKEKLKINSKGGIANREKNSTLKPKDVIYMRKNFIPRHSKFGVVAFSKKYGVTENTVRLAIKGKTFKDIK